MGTMRIDGFAPAKVNLTLHVTGQRADGYHLLDSLVVFADVGDRLTFTPAPDMALAVTGPFGDGVPCDGRNLVWKAAELAGQTGHITLEKNLPHGAGIGGGSSDAGALLRMLNSDAECAVLGADVPVCRLGKAARMSGIGDDVSLVSKMPAFNAVLVNPGVHVPTPQIFKALVQKDNPSMPVALPATDNFADWVDWLNTQRNDLQGPAIATTPIIAEALNALSDAALARMSGSGATCFGLCATADHAKTLAQNITRTHPDWWVVACTLS